MYTTFVMVHFVSQNKAKETFFFKEKQCFYILPRTVIQHKMGVFGCIFRDIWKLYGTEHPVATQSALG